MSDRHAYPHHDGLIPPYGGTDEDWITWSEALPAPSGFKVKVTECSAERTVMLLEDSPIDLNPNGALFGGLVPTIADAAAGSAFMRATPAGTLPATVNITTEFHRPAFLPLTFEATMTQVGRSVAFCHVDVRRADGKLSNTAQIVFSVIQATD